MTHPEDLPAELLLREQALLWTGLAFTISDALADDQPIVWVNPAFTTMTGYEPAEVLGRNCRFLQGLATDLDAVARVRDHLRRDQPVSATLLNYRKDGTSFWNELNISPIRNADGVLTHHIGVQIDVSAAKASQTRIRAISESMNQLSGTLDFDEAREKLISLVVPGLADWVLIVNVDDRGDIVEVVGRHCDPAKADLVASFAHDMPQFLKPGSPVEDLLLRGAPVRRMLELQSEASRAERLLSLSDPGMLGRSAEIGADSALLLQLPCRRTTNDLMILLRDQGRVPFDDEDVEVSADLSRRAGLILDNARLFRTTQRIAETLQRSLLPELPKIEGVEVAARYVAAGAGAEVGGDFYELIDLPGDAVGLVVGDVLGHDVLAAAAMGHLKGVIRACAYDDRGSPASVLERVDSLVAGLGMPTIATAVYAHVVPRDGGWGLTSSNAGHPPLVARFPDGHCELLTSASPENDLLLGVEPAPRTEAHRVLPDGVILVGYTDGLVERRDESLDVGLERLRAAVAAGPDDVEGLCDHLVSGLRGGNEDDVAVIALRLGGR